MLLLILFISEIHSNTDLSSKRNYTFLEKITYFEYKIKEQQCTFKVNLQIVAPDTKNVNESIASLSPPIAKSERTLQRGKNNNHT